MNMVGAVVNMVTNADKEGADSVMIRKGTLALVAIVPTFLMLILSYGGTIVTFIRNDETKSVQLNQLAETVKQIQVEQKSQSTDVLMIKQSLNELKQDVKAAKPAAKQ